MLYIKPMSIDTIQSKIEQKMAMAARLNAKVKFNFEDDGVIAVDTTQSPPVINQEDIEDQDVELITSVDTMEDILNGTQDPNIAFMMGKLKVKGSMGLALKLNGILED